MTWGFDWSPPPQPPVQPPQPPMPATPPPEAQTPGAQPPAAPRPAPIGPSEVPTEAPRPEVRFEDLLASSAPEAQQTLGQIAQTPIGSLGIPLPEGDPRASMTLVDFVGYMAQPGNATPENMALLNALLVGLPIADLVAQMDVGLGHVLTTTGLADAISMHDIVMFCEGLVRSATGDTAFVVGAEFWGTLIPYMQDMEAAMGSNNSDAMANVTNEIGLSSRSAEQDLWVNWSMSRITPQGEE